MFPIVNPLINLFICICVYMYMYSVFLSVHKGNHISQTHLGGFRIKAKQCCILKWGTSLKVGM